MISPQHSEIPTKYRYILDRINRQGVQSWLNPEKLGPDLDGLTYLCKFAYFTGLLNKAELADILELTKKEKKELVKSWYNDHREKGCGTC